MTARRREVEALEAGLGDKVMALDGRVGALQATSLADAEKTYAKGATAAAVNAELCELQTYARGEAAACVLDLRKIERFITLHVPKVEDGNNFGVAIQLEVAKLVKETGKECKGLLDALPTYHKDRAALLEKVVARTTTETSESKSSSNDEEKGTEAKNTSKSGTSTGYGKKSMIFMRSPVGAGSIETTLLQLVANAAAELDDYRVFEAKFARAMLQFKWERYARRVFYQQFGFFLLHLLLLLLQICYPVWKKTMTKILRKMMD